VDLFNASRATVLFDGVCELCNRSVKFISDRDPQGLIQFVPMQSEAGARMLREHHLDPQQMSTVVMIDRGRVYTRSTAVLRILRRLRRPEAWAMVAIPRPVRDLVYDWIARNRYRWFGGNESAACPMPSRV
jgi:predicted DCC family thiol-disulfide oxidoreductase YuxK